MKKKIMITALAALLLIGGPILYVLKQHSYDMTEKPVEIVTPQGKLTGILAMPEQVSGKLGLVLFIHGDGAIDATHDEGYKPLWERLAARGYASLSLNKRGLNGSEGNWLQMSMEDRVEEAQQAIAWAKTQDIIDADRIGVWGASQAGWVIPKLAGKEKLAFSILVSPAINWLTQGEYYTRSHMAKNGYSREEIERRVEYEKRIIELLERNVSYEQYAAIAAEDHRMSRERWEFAGKNYKADASGDLENFTTPVLLLLGEEDIHVDVAETAEVYRKLVDPRLLTTVLLPDTEHSMLSPATADSGLRALAISLFAPRRITVEGYMDAIDTFIIR